MRARRFLLVLTALSLSACKDGLVTPDQFGSITGRVVDFQTGSPIPGAGITTTPATDATVTDAEGTFTVTDAVVGSYTISANRNGYTPNTAAVSVRQDRATQATVFLRPSTDPGNGGTPAASLSAEVTNFFNRRISTVRGDSTVVVIDYRVNNTGTALIPGYQVIFRIQTPAGDFFQEVRRTTPPLAVGQSNVGRVEKDTGGAPASGVLVDATFIDGQTGTTRPAARQANQPSK